MSKKLLENYIRETLILNENTGGSDEPTFGQVKALLGRINKKKWTKKIFKRVWGFGKAVLAVKTGGLIDLDSVVKEAGKYVDADVVNALLDTLQDAMSDKLGGVEIDFSSMSPDKLLARMYGINDKPGLKKLEIPDEISELIDDKVEAKFMTHLWEEVKKQPDDKIIADGWVLEKLKEYTKNINTKTKGAFAEN